MKRLRPILWMCAVCFLLEGCVVSPGLVRWDGPSNMSAYVEDSILTDLSLERKAKQLTLPPFFIFIKQKGYRLTFGLNIKPEQYKKIDSIQYQVWTKTDRLLIQSTLVQENEFKTFSGAGTAQLVDSYPSLASLRKLKEDLWMDFTLYVQTPEKTQRKFTYHKYPLERSYGCGLYWFPF